MSLTKFLIFAFDEKKLIKHNATFEFPINPESYSRDLKIKQDKTQAQGTQSNDPKTKKIPPEEIKLEFIFDNTGTVQGNTLDGTEVNKQIEAFLDATYKFHGKIHEPKKLKLGWGDFVFSCKLTSLSINYPLFNEEGKPLRAKLNGTFTGYIEPELRVLKEGKQSPDLTHVRTFSGEADLPWMTHDIYGKTDYYLQVAKINGLTSPRLVPANGELIFPPVKKSTE